MNELEHLERYSAKEQELILTALAFATKQHATQTRRDGKTPYIVHPIAVAQSLIDVYHADADTVIAGLLHDTVEDTEATLDQIDEMFGSHIRFLVDGVTDVGKGDGKPFVKNTFERAKLSKEKTLAYAAKDKRILLVKIADRFDNVLTIHNFTPHGQVGYATDTLMNHVKWARKLGFTKQADEAEQKCKEALARHQSEPL